MIKNKQLFYALTLQNEKSSKKSQEIACFVLVFQDPRYWIRAFSNYALELEMLKIFFSARWRILWT